MEDINNQINNLVLRNHLIVNDSNMEGLQLKMLEQTLNQTGVPSKMRNALAAIFMQ